MAKNFSAELQRLARGRQACRPGVQHRAAIAQARDAFAVQQMGVDARSLRRGVGAQTQHAAAKLVDEFEGLQIEFAAGARKKRLEVLEQRRDNKLKAIATGPVKHCPSQLFEPPCLTRQNVSDVLWQ